MASFWGEPIEGERSSCEGAEGRDNRRLAYRKTCSICLVKLIRLGKLAEGFTYKWQGGKMLGIYSFSLSDEVFGKTVIEMAVMMSCLSEISS